MRSEPDIDVDRTLRRIRAGDREAYAELVRRFEGPLFGFFGRMGLSRAQAEDLAQESFLRAWRSLDRFDPIRARFSTWLFAIARNLALDEHAQVATTRVDDAAVETAEERVDERPGPAEALALQQRLRALRAALRTLAPAERCVLALSYVSELDSATIARLEGCSVGALRVRLHRARLRLRELLEREHA